MFTCNFHTDIYNPCFLVRLIFGFIRPKASQMLIYRNNLKKKQKNNWNRHGYTSRDHIFSPPTPDTAKPWRLVTSLFDIFFDRPGIDFKNCDRCQHSFHTVFEAGVTLFQQIVAGQIRGSEGLSHCPSICGKKTLLKVGWFLSQRNSSFGDVFEENSAPWIRSLKKQSLYVCIWTWMNV